MIPLQRASSTDTDTAVDLLLLHDLLWDLLLLSWNCKNLSLGLVAIFIVSATHSRTTFAQEASSQKTESTKPDYFDMNQAFLETFRKDAQYKDIADKMKSKGDLAYDQFKDVLRTMSNRQRNTRSPLMKIYNDTKSLSSSDYNMRYASMRFENDTPRDAEASSLVNAAIRGEATATLSEMLTNKISFMNTFKAGTRFDFDLSNLFGGDSSSQKETAKRRDPIRYKLVLKDVEPPKETYDLAANIPFEEEWQYATQAKPVWDIQPTSEEVVRNPMRVNIDQRYYRLNIQDQRSYYANDEDLPFNMVNAVNKKKLPSTKMTTNIRPMNFSGASGGLPPMEITLQQEENLYTLSYITSTNEIRKERMTHNLRAPIYKQLTLLKIYDESFESIETVAENILVSDQLPSLSIHHLEKEERFMARFSYSKDRSQLSILAETPPNFDFGKDFGKTPGERYRINYRYIF